MTLSLTDAEGRPISAFGSHASWNQGAVTNPASTTDTGCLGTSGNAAGSTGTAKITATTAGSTSKLGYQNPAAGSGGPPHVAPMTVQPPPLEPPRTNPDEQPGSNPVGEMLQAVARHYGPQEQPTRNGQFSWGQHEAKPGFGAAAEDLADVAEVV